VGPPQAQQIAAGLASVCVSDVSVIHLVWAPLGPAPVERFARSYREHAAGLAHRLVVVLNGFAAESDAEPYLAAFGGLEYETLFLERATLDLPAYGTAAERVDADVLCFLNSHSELLAGGWLAALREQHERADVGIVGATGSFERPHSVLPWRRRRWPAFPNPHLRSNAFLLRRDLMRSLQWPEVAAKHEAWALESGRAGLTAQVLQRGLAALVVGRDGTGYAPADWQASATFRSGDQENLLVADNRTRQWEEAEPAERERLTRLTWGGDPRAVAAALSALPAAGAAPGRPPTATR